MKRVNLARLKRCMQRAEKGGELTIGFLGGSITQGSLATEHESCYAYRVFRWWQENFPKSKFAYVNGGIGGTDSLFGVSRAVTDVLMYQPDVVVVDFRASVVVLAAFALAWVVASFIFSRYCRECRYF